MFETGAHIYKLPPMTLRASARHLALRLIGRAPKLDLTPPGDHAETSPPQPDPFHLLAGHTTIAWDLDDTLIGHAASPRMAAFIRANPQLRHLIITFRQHRTRDRIWTDLAIAQPMLQPSSFFVAEAIDDALAEAFARTRRQRAKGLFAGPPTPIERAYLHWKGTVAARHGATVLIDDMTDHVRLGCEAHGVVLLHPDVFDRTTRGNPV